ncbi:MAG: GNAT family N-acetyltransferase [Mobilicoccus sp.]|nr:GNAT family N-acetyltransferase [Mobilicoccus sp.]
MSSIVDTPMEPTDIAEAARLHERGFPSFFLTSLGAPFLREFYRGHLHDDTAVTVVARLDDGRPVGIVVGTTRPAGFYGRLLRRRGAAFAVTGALGALRRPSAIPRLFRAFTYRGDAPDPQAALLSSIVVDPAHAGRGIGEHLQRRWCEEAARRGAPRAYLQTDRDDNDPVRRFYERCGWRESATTITPEGRALVRYERSLEGTP